MLTTSAELRCSHCNETMLLGTRWCKTCGRVYSSDDLQRMAAQQWSSDLRALKIALLFSGTATSMLAWYAFAGF